MKLTVKDCLELNAFAGAEVLAHREGLAGNVSSVSVFDSTHKGDSFITVSDKNSGEVVVAYNENLFDYKE